MPPPVRYSPLFNVPRGVLLLCSIIFAMAKAAVAGSANADGPTLRRSSGRLAAAAAKVTPKSPAPVNPRAIPAAPQATSSFQTIEFGGPIGASCIVVFSHALLYYVYYCLQHNNGRLWIAHSFDDVTAALHTITTNAAPTWFAAVLYFGFLGFEGLLALVAPGLQLTGRPDETGQKLTYNCNAYVSWWVTLATIAALHYFEIFHMSAFIQNYGSVMTVAIIFADVQSLCWYIYAFVSGHTHHMTGNHVYDMFMGAILHPRLFGGRLDIKMFAEIRVSWFLLFILTLSCAVERFETTGTLPLPMAFMVLAHFMYANATSKGEHFVPPTWDITYEKYGWMLCFWNFAGVPFLYCKSSVYLLKYGTVENMPSDTTIVLLTVALLVAYYVWDTAQSQKSYFRLATTGGTVVRRITFPYLPWQVLDNPTFLTTKRGTPLLVDGWWRYARKIHYTCDIIMALTWALATGTSSALPYIYPAFFMCMILHRYTRDDAKCARLYGDDWKRYRALVPYAFIPGVL